MSKGKLAKFADMERFSNVYQYPIAEVCNGEPDVKGHWHDVCFKNPNPIVLELGCGRGEYTVALAERIKDKNFIGVDIKGARMWSGAKQALEEGLDNAAFLRTNIEIIDRFFSAGEVEEIWLTFSDPQMKNIHKRLTSTFFMERYQRFLKDGGLIHLKTDSEFLFTYTLLMLQHNGIKPEVATRNLYGDLPEDDLMRQLLTTQTYFEQQWISRGIDIKYLRFRLSKDLKLEESGIEVEFDDYRSCGRTRRSERSKGV